MIQSLTAGEGLKCTHDLKWVSSKWLLKEKKGKKEGRGTLWQLAGEREKKQNRKS